MSSTHAIDRSTRSWFKAVDTEVNLADKQPNFTYESIGALSKGEPLVCRCYSERNGQNQLALGGAAEQANRNTKDSQQASKPASQPNQTKAQQTKRALSTKVKCSPTHTETALFEWQQNSRRLSECPSHPVFKHRNQHRQSLNAFEPHHAVLLKVRGSCFCQEFALVFEFGF